MNTQTKVIEVELKLKKVSQDFAHFSHGKNFSGIIHTPDNGNLTVILDGGYVLGEFDCVLCAVGAITNLGTQIIVSDEITGLNYQTYKKHFA